MNYFLNMTLMLVKYFGCLVTNVLYQCLESHAVQLLRIPVITGRRYCFGVAMDVGLSICDSVCPLK